MRLSIYIALLTVGGALVSCDDGKIHDDSLSGNDNVGITVQLTGSVTGTATYGDDYNVALAAFMPGSEYAAVSKEVEDGNLSVTLAGVSPEAATVELCLLNRLRKRVAVYASADMAAAGNTVSLDAGAVDVRMWAVLQHEVFDRSCAQCHGGSTGAAAGLRLTDGESYASLVGVASKKDPAAMLVSPGNAAESVLWHAVATDMSQDWRFRHIDLISSDMQIFIRDWINLGAEQ